MVFDFQISPSACYQDCSHADNAYISENTDLSTDVPFCAYCSSDSCTSCAADGDGNPKCFACSNLNGNVQVGRGDGCVESCETGEYVFVSESNGVR